MLLFLVASFALIIGFLKTPSIEFYTGGVIIALFMAGLFFAWGNSILQTRKMDEKQKEEPKPAEASSSPPASPNEH
jgi:hypothetical protein